MGKKAEADHKTPALRAKLKEMLARSAPASDEAVALDSVRSAPES